MFIAKRYDLQEIAIRKMTRQAELAGKQRLHVCSDPTLRHAMLQCEFLTGQCFVCSPVFGYSCCNAGMSPEFLCESAFDGCS